MGVARGPMVRKFLKQMVETAASRLGLTIIPSWRLGSLAHATDLRHVFRQLGIDTVLDVGANEGGYRRFLRQQVGFRGRIVSFEPVASVYLRLAADASGDSNWAGMPIALGDADGELTINVGARTTMSSFLQPDTPRLAGLGYSHLMQVTGVVSTETTSVRRLDSVFRDVVPGPDSRVFLKCDTQGFDLKVIAGATDSLQSIAALQIEMSFKPIYVGAPDYSAVLEQMTAAGFDVAGIYPVRRDELLRMVNFDCLMINSRHRAVLDMAPAVRGRTA
jgi:FkbM family methyltransferase